MDFVERLFHVSPDAGSGSTEAIYLLVMLALVLAVVYREPIRRRIRWLR
jgi:hypothetical protein